MDKTNLRESYKFYESTIREENTTRQQNAEKRGEKFMLTVAVDSKTYLKIVCGMFQFLFSLVLTGYDIKLGDRLGNLGIRGRKVKPKLNEKGEIIGLAPNWAKTKEHWAKEAMKRGLSFKEYIEQVPKSERVIVRCFNEHSDGMRYKLYWYKKKSIITNITYYSLVLNRTNKRAISKAVKAGRDYLSLREVYEEDINKKL